MDGLHAHGHVLLRLNHHARYRNRILRTNRQDDSFRVKYTNNNDPDAVPTVTTNHILDAIETALAPTISDPGFLDERNTLGGLVHHCFLNGKVTKVSGDLDGAALITVPITILAP